MRQCKNLSQIIFVFADHLVDFVGSQMFTCLISLNINSTDSALADCVICYNTGNYGLFQSKLESAFQNS